MRQRVPRQSRLHTAMILLIIRKKGFVCQIDATSGPRIIRKADATFPDSGFRSCRAGGGAAYWRRDRGIRPTANGVLNAVTASRLSS